MKTGTDAKNGAIVLIENILYDLHKANKKPTRVFIRYKVNSKYPLNIILKAMEKLFNKIDNNIDISFELKKEDGIPIEECYLEYKLS